MKIDSLDHVALWVDDRDSLADLLTQHLGMHQIDRTDRFTLVGSDARRGKLTLFAAEGPREPGALARVVLRVSNLEAALLELPDGLPVQRQADGVVAFEGPSGLGLGLVEREDDGVDYDLDHVVLRVPDPAGAFERLTALGFIPDGDRLRAGGEGEAFLRLEDGGSVEGANPLLNHLGLRVESADAHRLDAERAGAEIADVVDGANTYAVFVWGPDRIKLEYVEHKPDFSLV